MSNAIEVRDLNKKYDNFALKNINLDVPKGTVFGLIGKNGSGKSTLIKSLIGINHSKYDSLDFFGLPYKDNIKKINDSLAVIFDQSCYDESFTPYIISKVMRNVYKSWDDEKFNHYLKEFELPLKKKIQDFSRGMKMKLEFAVAFSHDTKILILDEATSGLDPIIRDEILDILRKYTLDEDHTVIISSHITSDLDKIADYIALIDDGQIHFIKSYHEIINNYGLVKCGEEVFHSLNEEDVIAFKKTRFSYNVLVKDRYAVKKVFKNIIIENVSLEEIMLYIVKGEKK